MHVYVHVHIRIREYGCFINILGHLSVRGELASLKAGHPS